MSPSTTKAQVIQLDEIPSVRCSCGQSRRAFGRPEHTTSSLHMVDISEDARPHYHKMVTETYYVLEGEGHIELDGEKFPVRAGSAILIPPGTRHRAVGKMRILNFPVPAYDPADEYFD